MIILITGILGVFVFIIGFILSIKSFAINGHIFNQSFIESIILIFGGLFLMSIAYQFNIIEYIENLIPIQQIGV